MAQLKIGKTTFASSKPYFVIEYGHLDMLAPGNGGRWFIFDFEKMLTIKIAFRIYVNVFDNSPTSKSFDYVIGFILIVLYYTLIEASTGRSIGKYITGTKIVNMQGEKPNTSTIIIRSMCRCIPFEPFSFFNSKASGWHDSMSGTRVVNVKHFLD